MGSCPDTDIDPEIQCAIFAFKQECESIEPRKGICLRLTVYFDHFVSLL